MGVISKLLSSGGQKTAHVVFNLGQSTQVGVTEAGGLGLISSWYNSQDKIKIFWNGAFENMWIDHNTVDASILGNADTRWGPEQATMHDLQNYVGGNVFLYKLAIGGIPISYFQPSGSLYTRFHSDIPDIFTALAALGYTKIKCYINWQQGESNSGTTRSDYATALSGVIDDLRGFNSFMAAAPVVLVKLSTTYSGNGPTTISNINGAFSDTKSNKSSIYLIDRDVLGCVPNVSDNIHDDDPSKLLIGHAIFDLWKTNHLL